MMKHMKVITFAVLMPVLFAGALAAQTNPEPPKFTIVIGAVKPEVPLGSNIAITITITNISEEPITMKSGYHGNMPDGIYYDIRDEQGAKVNKFGKRYAHFSNGDSMEIPKPPGSTRLGGLKPGDRVMTGTTISDDYDLDHPGKYTIRAWMPATMGTPGKPDLNRVYSNTITITVLPAGSTSSTDSTLPAQQ